jgi:hypothetical protein
MKNAVKAKPLNEAQLMVLQVVNEQYDEQDIKDLHKLLLDFNNSKMQQHLDETIAQKGYSATDFENILTGHMRKAH